jgi:flagellar biosynthesis/type III secretory pathway M-ring protein FliF/YscJ
MYQAEILNYFPSFQKTPVYIDNTNTILFIHHSLSNIIINLIINVSNFIKKLFFITSSTLSSSIKSFTLVNSRHLFNLNSQLFAIILIMSFITFIIYIKYLINNLRNKIEDQEQKIRFLNKKDNMLENDVERYTMINKKLQEEIDKKLQNYEKEMKKMKKEINKYN